MSWTKRQLVAEAYAELALAGFDFDLTADWMAAISALDRGVEGWVENDCGLDRRRELVGGVGRLGGDQFAICLSGVLDSALLERTCSELLELLDLTPVANERFESYSTGTKQRFAIARGLLHRPQVLFMDEPTKGVDPKSSAGIISPCARK